MYVFVNGNPFQFQSIYGHLFSHWVVGGISISEISFSKKSLVSYNGFLLLIHIVLKFQTGDCLIRQHRHTHTHTLQLMLHISNIF